MVRRLTVPGPWSGGRPSESCGDIQIDIDQQGKFGQLGKSQ